MVVVALRGPRIRAPPNIIATLIRRHFKRPPGASSGRNTKPDEQRDIKLTDLPGYHFKNLSISTSICGSESIIITGTTSVVGHQLQTNPHSVSRGEHQYGRTKLQTSVNITTPPPGALNSTSGKSEIGSLSEPEIRRACTLSAPTTLSIPTDRKIQNYRLAIDNNDK
jgi:hypothetical protein